MKNWKDFVDIKINDKKQTYFTVSEDVFAQFHSIEWEKSINIKKYEHDFIKKTITIIFTENG